MTDAQDVMMEQLLRRTAGDGPDPRLLAQRALRASQARSPERRRLDRPIAIPTGLVAALGALWALMYFVPSTEALVTAATPGAVSAQVLDRAGLNSRDLTETGATMSSNGVTVKVLGLYADSFRTVLMLQSASGLLDPSSLKLSDQFGHEYGVTDATGNSETGIQVVTFSPLGAPSNILGARVHISANRLTNGQQSIGGDWKLDAIVIPKVSTNLHLDGGPIGNRTATFDSVQQSGASVQLKVRISGAPIGDTSVANGKPAPGVSVVLTDSNGTSVPSSMSIDYQTGATAVTALWVGVPAGHYQLELTALGSSLTRELAVPKG
ncbi:MAG TPA: hypothetical protein VID48_13540 [Solirubrobacteraceae bacterium]